jgi:hypothetical protein
MQLKRLERVVNLDGVTHYYWRYSDKPMIATPEILIIKTTIRAKLDTCRWCSYGERDWHVTYVLYWGRISIQESYDVINPRWSLN